MTDNKGKGLSEFEAQVPEKAPEAEDDIYDDIYRDVVKREVSHREGRSEGDSLSLQMPADGEYDFISYGQKEMIDRLDERLGKDKVKHRGIEVGRYPAGDAEKLEKVRGMAERQVSDATRRRKALEEKLNLPALPGVIEEKLLAAEGVKSRGRGSGIWLK